MPEVLEAVREHHVTPALAENASSYYPFVEEPLDLVIQHNGNLLAAAEAAGISYSQFVMAIAECSPEKLARGMRALTILSAHRVLMAADAVILARLEEEEEQEDGSAILAPNVATKELIEAYKSSSSILSTISDPRATPPPRSLDEILAALPSEEREAYELLKNALNDRDVQEAVLRANAPKRIVGN